MQSPPEKLSPRQQRGVTAIFLVLFLAFGSVFAYAYIQGQRVWRRKEAILIAQQNRNRAFRAQQSRQKVSASDQPKKIVERVARGTTGRTSLTAQEFSGELSFARGWSILKRGKSVADNDNPRGWFVSATGMVTVPKDAPIGDGYDARHAFEEHREYYQFEVVAAEKSSRTVTPKAQVNSR